MRPTITALGLELDLSLGPATPAEDDDRARDLSGGTVASTPVGFTASHEQPDMVGLPPDRSNGWTDEDRRR